MGSTRGTLTASITIGTSGKFYTVESCGGGNGSNCHVLMEQPTERAFPTIDTMDIYSELEYTQLWADLGTYLQ
jgi:hypothetical protein